MAAATLPELLARLPWFAALDRDLRERLAAGCRLRTCAAGELLFARGAPATAWYGVLEGTVRLFRSGDDGRTQVLHTLRPGQTFAEAAVLTLRRYPASAEARLARYLLRLPARAQEGSLRVALPLRKRELAAQLAITPETLSRLLRRWQDQEWVRTEGSALTLLDPGALTALAEPKNPDP